MRKQIIVNSIKGAHITIEQNNNLKWIMLQNLSQNKINNIIKFAILLLILQDKSIIISGKQICKLKNIFGIHNVKLALKQKFLCQENKLINNIDNSFINNSISYFYNIINKNSNQNSQDNDNYWDQFPNATIKNAIMIAFKLKCPQTYFIELI